LKFPATPLGDSYDGTYERMSYFNGSPTYKMGEKTIWSSVTKNLNIGPGGFDDPEGVIIISYEDYKTVDYTLGVAATVQWKKGGESNIVIQCVDKE